MAGELGWAGAFHGSPVEKESLWGDIRSANGHSRRGKAVDSDEGTPTCRTASASCVPAGKPHAFHSASPHRHVLPSDTTSVTRQSPGCKSDGAPGVGGALHRSTGLSCSGPEDSESKQPHGAAPGKSRS